MDGHNYERLKAHILPLSQAQDFDLARREWSLVAVELSEEWDNCPCGQDIKEHCFIRNGITGKQTYVGNVCIKRFIGIDTGTLFDGLRRLSNDPSSNANAAVVEHAWKNGFLYDEREYRFLLQIMRKRKLSEAQQAWKIKANRRILQQTVVARRTRR
jgi:hypothetical protein